MIIATFDIETDPFLYGRAPKPFACEFFSEGIKKQWWGENCLYDFLKFLNGADEQYMIYAHNGGKFDFWFLLYLSVIGDPIKIINGRLVECHIAQHTLRDSYAIIPVSLATYQKTEIDYNKFELGNREENKKEILEYLHDDCIYLYDLVYEFNNKFGNRLTIGGTAINELKKHHEIKRTGHSHDDKFRPYYFGGRVECYKRGVIKGDFKIYDVNSMYPFVMSNMYHPVGEDYINITGNFFDFFNDTGDYKQDANAPYFLRFVGTNKGALPTRTKIGLDFNVEYGEFYATSHEIKIALKHNLITIDKIIECRVATDYCNYREFVDFYVDKKIQAKLDDDAIMYLFFKLILNSAYGKFGQNPEKFYDYELIYVDEEPLSYPWTLHIDGGDFEIWRKPVTSHLYFDVAIAASITGAARGVLLRAMSGAVNMVYCDTDSIICESLAEVDKDETRLGAWDVEGQGDKIALCGKKLYALFNNCDCVKMASKGARLVPEDIIKIADGETVLWTNDAPSFKLDLSTQFVSRNIKMR